jgi:hypothetical protein
MASKPKAVPVIIRNIYRQVARLEALHPGRKFTPDGHLVGSLGEAHAAYSYKLELLPNSKAGHDARNRSGRLVQIKTTQRSSVGLTSRPQLLLVLRLSRDGTFREVYNGPGTAPWRAAGPMQKNGQRAISLSKLERLMDEIPGSRRIKSRAA